MKSSTWLVADLQSKANLQQQFLRETACLPETAVLRASEFWRHILKNYFPDIDIVSPQFLSVWLHDWLKKQNISWAQSPGASQKLIDSIELFLPILERPHFVEKLREWLAQNTGALVRWGHWFFLSQKAWELLSAQKILLSRWVPGFLAAAESLPDDFWPYDLMVDLGSALTAVEAELLEKLSRSRAVNVQAPGGEARARHAALFSPYEILAQTPRIQISIVERSSGFNSQPSFHRFSSELAEIKAAVHWLREAADRGVPLDQLGIFSADIERYWPILEAYLRVEGLPVRKPVVTPVASLPAMQNWLSRLRIEIQNLSSGDLEAAVYSRRGDESMAYDRFASLYRRLYDEEDLKRDDSIRRLFTQSFGARESLDRERFFAWSLQFYEGGAPAVERIAAVFFQDCRSQLRLEARSWVRYLEGLVSRIEVETAPAHAGGLYCGNLDAALSLELDTAIVLGLDSNSIRPPEKISVSETDREKLARDLGINLTAPLHDWSYWVERLISQTKSPHACFALHDLMGRPQSPAAVWLEGSNAGANLTGACETAGATRWDEIQANAGEIESADGEIHLDRLPKLSPSQLENYLACPFKFAAEKIFQLSDRPEVDLDLDAATGGRMIHEILKRLLEPPLKWQRPQDELEKLVDEVRDELDVMVGAQVLWGATRSRMVKIAERFLEFERKWRQEFPDTRTVLREGPVSGAFAPRGNDATIEVTGRIDRVDANSRGEYVVLDYKWSGGNALHNYTSWIENDELQLLFYSFCIEQGLTSLPPGPVLGAFYYTIVNMEREKGFRDKNAIGEGATRLYGEARGKSPLERPQIEKLYAQLKEKTADVIGRIQGGQFAPKPLDFETCHECNWRTVCRAPHLN